MQSKCHSLIMIWLIRPIYEKFMPYWHQSDVSSINYQLIRNDFRNSELSEQQASFKSFQDDFFIDTFPVPLIFENEFKKKLWSIGTNRFWWTSRWGTSSRPWRRPTRPSGTKPYEFATRMCRLSSSSARRTTWRGCWQSWVSFNLKWFFFCVFLWKMNSNRDQKRNGNE